MDIKKIYLSFLLSLLSTLFFSCVSLGDNYQFDDWHNIPEYAEQDDFIETKLAFDEIKKQYLSTSIEKLKRKEYYKLSKSEAYKLTGKRKLKKAILVRALYYSYPSGVYTLYKSKNDLWLQHGVLSTATKQHKHAIVLYVENYPEKLYVGCSVHR